MSFNTSFFNPDKGNFTTDHKKIAKRYLKTWFFIDFIAVIDFEWILKTFLAEGGFGSINKVAKIARFYRSIKLFRLLKMTKLAKERKNLHSSIQDHLVISVAVERILFFTVCFILFMHTLACLWILEAFEM